MGECEVEAATAHDTGGEAGRRCVLSIGREGETAGTGTLPSFGFARGDVVCAELGATIGLSGSLVIGDGCCGEVWVLGIGGKGRGDRSNGI